MSLLIFQQQHHSAFTASYKSDELMRLNWERKTGLLALALALYWLGPAPCHGQGSTIVYGRLWNPNPQNPPPPWDDSGYPVFSSLSGALTVDLNGDGQPDVGFADDDMSFYIYGFGSTRVLTHPPAGLDINSFLPVLPAGTEIGATPPDLSLIWRETLNLPPSGPYSATYNGANSEGYAGYWQGVQGYTGVEFYIAGQPHYAWFRVGTPFVGTHGGYIYDYAYDTHPGAPILAGAVPEPGAAVLLLLGLAGVCWSGPQAGRSRLVRVASPN